MPAGNGARALSFLRCAPKGLMKKHPWPKEAELAALRAQAAAFCQRLRITRYFVGRPFIRGTKIRIYMEQP